MGEDEMVPPGSVAPSGAATPKSAAHLRTLPGNTAATLGCPQTHDGWTKRGVVIWIDGKFGLHSYADFADVQRASLSLYVARQGHTTNLMWSQWVTLAKRIIQMERAIAKAERASGNAESADARAEGPAPSPDAATAPGGPLPLPTRGSETQ